jgi:hypothetical protein
MFLLPTAELLNVVESVLLASGKPVEIGDLVHALIDLGAIESDVDFKKAVHNLYSKVWMEPKKHGDASRWQRTGKGMWCHIMHLSAANDIKAIRVLGEVKARIGIKKPRIEEADQKCGNCSHLRFFGVHFLKLNSGSCEEWPSPEVYGAYVRTAMPACPLWQQRSIAQQEQDQHQHKIDLIEVAKVNAGIHIRRRGDNKRVAPTGAKLIENE